MDQQTQPSSHNPLFKHFRQPSIYIKLPSGGKFWPEGSLNLSLNGEVGVLPMSTKDEITLKTPDALLNGQGVVDVIQSCCPSIVNAWMMPSIDVDSVIIAIRIASYGNEMEVDSGCPKCNEMNEYNLDLSAVLSNITAPNYAEKVSAGELKIKLKPQAYYHANQSNMLEFQEQQILRTVSQMENDPDQVRAIFREQLDKIIELNIKLLSSSTDYIEMPDGTIVTESAHIDEFYSKCDSKIIKAVKEKLATLSIEGGIKPVPVKCTHCEHPYEVGLVFDFASFFANGS